ncbi:putative 12-oxophytodienoate reductase 2 [Nymphon striatum]|nr:putative 12-oxophytodienoate reductase 2 [Nymphon striatum]
MVQGWKAVTEAVHEKGGRIFLQLWHVGRVSHPDFHGGALPVAPSAIGFDGDAFTPEGPKKIVTPRALEVSELPGIVEDFAKGAANAIAAGFDGVEIHGANGYLLDQFMRDGSNQREDAYGGSVENRLRFPLEVTDAVVAEVGRDKVGFRINPANIPPMGTFDSDPAALFGQLAQALSQRELAYLHVFEPGAAEFYTSQSGDIPAPLTPQLRAKFNGPLIANGGHGKDSATEMLAKGDADLIAFGSSFLANPDLPRRLAENIALNTPNRETFYQGEAVEVAVWVKQPARHLASKGAAVVLGARRLEKLESIAADIREKGGKVAILKTDVTRASDVKALVDTAVETFGRIDVMMNNAGIMPMAPLSALMVDEWDQMIDVNIKGVLYGIAAALPLFEKQNSGHFINLGSIASLKVASPGGTVYSGTKFAVRAISEGLRQEVGGSIRTTTIEPGAIDSELKLGSSHEASSQFIQEVYKSAISPSSIANAIAYAIEQPADVDINEIVYAPQCRISKMVMSTAK